MPRPASSRLSRRERQIMDVIYRRRRASVAEVLENIPDPPSYSAVRALLGILESKGHVRHVKDGSRYLYMPTRPRHSAGRSALRRVLQTFYDGSVEKTVAALLDGAASSLTTEELDRLAKLIEQRREEGR
jgi:predicted transcriptional regulator